MQNELDAARDKARQLEEEFKQATIDLEAAKRYLHYLHDNKHPWWITPLTIVSFILDAMLFIAIGNIFSDNYHDLKWLMSGGLIGLGLSIFIIKYEKSTRQAIENEESKISNLSERRAKI